MNKDEISKDFLLQKMETKEEVEKNGFVWQSIFQMYSFKTVYYVMYLTWVLYFWF